MLTHFFEQACVVGYLIQCCLASFPVIRFISQPKLMTSVDGLYEMLTLCTEKVMDLIS